MELIEASGLLVAHVASLANSLSGLEQVGSTVGGMLAQQPDGGGSAGLDIIGIILGLLAGIVLFLYGVNRMAAGLRQIGDDRVKSIMTRFTNTPLTGVLTGTAATTLLDSSSVTIIMTIALVNAGLLTFTQSLGVVMGANIGTTISSQIIAFDGVVLFIGFTPWIARGLERLIPDRRPDSAEAHAEATQILA